MSVSAKLTAVADQIRRIIGTGGTYSLDGMASALGTVAYQHMKQWTVDIPSDISGSSGRVTLVSEDGDILAHRTDTALTVCVMPVSAAFAEGVANVHVSVTGNRKINGDEIYGYSGRLSSSGSYGGGTMTQPLTVTTSGGGVGRVDVTEDGSIRWGTRSSSYIIPAGSYLVTAWW